jgi:ATP-binding cassette subfamily B protein
LIRILNSQSLELNKFKKVSKESKNIGIIIVNLFSSLIPFIGIIANGVTVVILFLGGKSIISGSLSIGDFSAFISYISMLIFPIVIIGFISNMISRAVVSYKRIAEIMNLPIQKHFGKITKTILGEVIFDGVNLKISNKSLLKNISFKIKAGSQTAIVGPTAAGKTQIFYLLAHLIKPSSGKIKIDDVLLSSYGRDSLASQLGIVFQDSIVFNTTIRENILFKKEASSEELEKAIKTADLDGFIDNLPNGIETIIAERGNSLSGGQKQRITLARALVLNPKILLLDDFTARVDKKTEQNIFKNLSKNYSDITQIVISQQIDSIKDFDQIILVMEGEVLASGTHRQLLKSSPEYLQIYESQQSLS